MGKSVSSQSLIDYKDWSLTGIQLYKVVEELIITADDSLVGHFRVGIDISG